MALNYFYKCNPKVAEALGLTGFDRYTFPDGTLLLWRGDMIALDRERFHMDMEGLLADIGAVRLTDPESAEEQRNPKIRLPEARLPRFRWEQPDHSTPYEGDGEDGDGDAAPVTDGHDSDMEAAEEPTP